MRTDLKLMEIVYIDYIFGSVGTVYAETDGNKISGNCVREN